MAGASTATQFPLLKPRLGGHLDRVVDHLRRVGHVRLNERMVVKSTGRDAWEQFVERLLSLGLIRD